MTDNVFFTKYSTSGIFIQQATTERAGVMRAQQVIDLNATKKAVAELEKILEIVQVNICRTLLTGGCEDWC